jgi:hypothetical protein
MFSLTALDAEFAANAASPASALDALACYVAETAGRIARFAPPDY